MAPRVHYKYYVLLMAPRVYNREGDGTVYMCVSTYVYMQTSILYPVGYIEVLLYLFAQTCSTRIVYIVQ